MSSYIGRQDGRRLIMGLPASLDCPNGKDAMTRALSVRLLLVTLFAAGVVHGRSDDSPYTQVARVPSIVDGHGLDAFAFDPVDRRLYAGSRNGVFWLDLRERELRLKGPMLRKPI